MNKRAFHKAAPLITFLSVFVVFSCNISSIIDEVDPIRISDPVQYDSDDPAIWVNSVDPSQSLIIGTDKDPDGALYVYDIEGNEIGSKTISGLNYPNNVDVEYRISLNGSDIDIAVVTERGAERLRVYQLPDMTPVDGGDGIPVFEGEANRECMGIALYKRPADGAVFAVVSRKDGPSGSYLWQYRLEDNGAGEIVGTHVRSFGLYSGYKEIEAIAVDEELGYIYYSDEQAGIRKYYADPDHPDADTQLAFFGTDDFVQDMEGISIYDLGDGTGYIIISDQQANTFNIYRREGSESDVHAHYLIKVVHARTVKSDGNEVTSADISPLYPGGLLVAMSDDKTFHYYSWEQFSKAPGRELLVK